MRRDGKYVNVRHTTYVETFLLVLVVLLPCCKCLCWLYLLHNWIEPYTIITEVLFPLSACSKSSKSDFGAGYLAAVAAAWAADSWGGPQKTTLATWVSFYKGVAAVAADWLLSVETERITLTTWASLLLLRLGLLCWGGENYPCYLNVAAVAAAWAAECWGWENYPCYLNVAAVAAAWLLSVGVERITLATWVPLLLLLPGLLCWGGENYPFYLSLAAVAAAWAAECWDGAKGLGNLSVAAVAVAWAAECWDG